MKKQSNPRKRRTVWFFAFVLLLSLLPGTALADSGQPRGEKAVSANTLTVRNVKRAAAGRLTWSGLQAMADESGKITLTGNTVLTDGGEMLADSAVRLDLAGCTLTIAGNGSFAVRDGGSLTVENGRILANAARDFLDENGTRSPASALAVIDVQADSSVTLDRVNYTTNGAAVRFSGSAASVSVKDSFVKGAVFALAAKEGEEDCGGVEIALTGSAFEGLSPLAFSVPGQLRMEGCTVTGVIHGAIVRCGTAEICGSVITQTFSEAEAGVSAETLTAYFESNTWGGGNMVPPAALVVGNGNDGFQYPVNVTLKDSALKAEGDADEQFPALYANANLSEGNGVTLYIDDASKARLEGEIVYGNLAASVDGLCCTTLQNAIEKAEKDSAVLLLKDLEIAQPIQVGGGQTVSLDLNGRTVTYSGDGAENAAFDVYGSLTISDSSEDRSGKITGGGTGILVRGWSETDAGSLTVNAGSIEGVDFGILCGGQYGGTDITVNGGRIAAQHGIFHPQAGTLTITGGEIGGCTGIELRAGTLTVSGDTARIAGWGADGGPPSFSADPDGDGPMVWGAGIAISPLAGDEAVEAGISGGTIEGCYALFEKAVEADPHDNIAISVSGGTFISVSGEPFLSGETERGGDGWSPAAVKCCDVTQFITGGTFDSDVSEYCAKTSLCMQTGAEGYIVCQPVISLRGESSIEVNSTAALEAAVEPDGVGVIWSSSNEKVAAVDQNGAVTGVSAGTAVISAAVKGAEVSASQPVTVRRIPVSVTISASATELDGGGPVTLTAAGPEGTAVSAPEGVTLAARGDGRYEVSLPDAAAEYTFTASFEGNDVYAPASSSVTVHVVQRAGGVPGAPGGPDVPDAPDTSDSPDTPDDPDAPNAPGAPDSSDAPDGPEGPGSPDGSDAPGSSTAPSAPAIPGAPGTSETPGGPDPGIPVSPDAPGSPGASGDENNAAPDDPNPDGGAADAPNAPGPGEETAPDGAEAFPALPFEDVAEDDWFYDAVEYVFQKNLMTGVSEETFSPGAVTQRAMIITVLHRMEGAPVTQAAPFPDVELGEWYADAVSWGADSGVIKGYEDGSFGPGEAITREQIAAILYRYASLKGYATDARADLSGYADAGLVGDYALEAMQWAVASELINGVDAERLSPLDAASRGQMAALLMRFCGQFLDSSDQNCIYNR